MELFPKRLTDFSISISIFISIYLLKYETIVRSSAWSDPDPDPSSVSRVSFQIDEISLDLLNKTKLLLNFSFLFQSSSPHTSIIVDLCALRRSQTTLIFVNLSEIFSTAKDFHTIMYLIGTLLRRYVTKVHPF